MDGSGATERPLISIVIPVWRDRDTLRELLSSLVGAPPDVEVVVAVALEEVEEYRELTQMRPVSWVTAPRGRALQMNAGADASRGEWLVFLHADSRPPMNWWTAIREAHADPRVVWGCFRFGLDTTDPRGRLLELGVRLRVCLFALPYGDQSIFVRREVFERLGRYRDLPLMEDVDLATRLSRCAPPLRARSTVLTSARRWERDGWTRRTLGNLWLLAQYFAGRSISRIARQYYGRHRVAVAVMARAPWTAGKTRLTADLRDDAKVALRWALFLDTLEVVQTVRETDHVVIFTPPDAFSRLTRAVGPTIDLIAQRAGSLGDRLTGAFDDVFRRGAEVAIIVGSDVPHLKASVIEDAVRHLSRHRNGVVLGPATDGGYYLIGLSGRHVALLQNIDWSTPRVLDQTIAAARGAGLDLRMLEESWDIDEPSDLAKLVAHGADARTAPRTRARMACASVTNEAGAASNPNGTPADFNRDPRLA